MGRLSAVALLALFGCAQQVGDIDRTQPNRIRKSVFDGEWYLARTVIDAPYTTEFTHVGDSAELERVRWEIQKDLLVAYRVYDRVQGSEKATTAAGEGYQGAPIVAYPILGHFDIQREYSESTGEQSNVIVENDHDRPWYDREFMRVDWSKNVLPSLSFLVDWEGSAHVTETPMSYNVEDPEHPDHMVVGVRGADGSWTDHRRDEDISALASADYLETTTRIAVKPAEITVEDWYGTTYVDPMCWYYANADCEHQNLRIRTSFMKVPSKSSYVPLYYPDNLVARDPKTGKPITVSRDADGNIVADPDGTVVRFPMFDKFGYFRVERHGYDPVYGETESGRTYLITRYNLLDESGNPRPIVYYLSEDYPERLKASAQEIADGWNDAFVDAVKALGKAPPAKMFEIRENHAEGEAPRRIGDMRWSFLFDVQKPTLAGLLGYGPMNADPLTGEILSGSAYVYGAQVLTYSGYGRQIVDLQNGRLSPEDLGLGEDVKELLYRMRTTEGTTTSALTVDTLTEFYKERVDNDRGKALKKLGKKKLKVGTEWFAARLGKIRGTEFESRLVNDEVKLLKGKRVIGPGDAIPQSLQPYLSPLSWAGRENRLKDRKRRLKLAHRGKDLAEFADDAVAGYALELKDKPPEEVLALIEEKVFKSTAEHEIGHTLGLRHNFAGSYDALNFPKEFWVMHGGEAAFPAPPRTAKQIAGKMDEYRYSSIMEYAGRFDADIQGLGRYDKAAILFGYAQSVEVFENAPNEPLATTFGDVFDLTWPFWQVRHYSSLPSILGGIDAMYQRKVVPYSEIQAQLTGLAPFTHWEVPYRFCSDEYDGAASWCSTYDAGMDSYEIVDDAAQRYHAYYFFQAFKRDRAGWDGSEYDGTMYDRYFRHMLTQYQHWALDEFDMPGIWSEWQEDPALGLGDKPWDLSIDGGMPALAASHRSLQFLQQVLAMPEPGAYLYDPDLELYWRWSASAYDQCTGTDKEKDDPDLDCVDLNVPLGVGRPPYTSYDFESGYYFYERPKWVGAWSDKVLALEMLSDPTVSLLGVNTNEDIQGYAIGFFLYFPDLLSKIAGGIVADKVSEFAGTTKDGVYYPPDPFAPKPADRDVVDPNTWSTVQYYAMWFGMAGFNLGFDNRFNDLMKVWVEGDGEGQAVPDPNDPNVATYYDAATQRTYHAIKDPDPKFFSVGFQLVSRAAALSGEIAELDQEIVDWADDPEYLDILYSNRSYAEFLLDSQIELMDLARGMYSLYGKMTF